MSLLAACRVNARRHDFRSVLPYCPSDLELRYVVEFGDALPMTWRASCGYLWFSTNHRTARMNSAALLTGRIYDDRGNRVSPSHVRKGGLN